MTSLCAKIVPAEGSFSISVSEPVGTQVQHGKLGESQRYHGITILDVKILKCLHICQ